MHTSPYTHWSQWWVSVAVISSLTRNSMTSCWRNKTLLSAILYHLFMVTWCKPLTPYLTQRYENSWYNLPNDTQSFDVAELPTMRRCSWLLVWPSYLCLLYLKPLNAELNLICYLLALLGAHPILHVSKIRVKTSSFTCKVSRGAKWRSSSYAKIAFRSVPPFITHFPVRLHLKCDSTRAETTVRLSAKRTSPFNTLRTRSFKLFKRPFPGFLTILTL